MSYAIVNNKPIPVSDAIASALGVTFETEAAAMSAENIRTVNAFGMSFGVPAPAPKPAKAEATTANTVEKMAADLDAKITKASKASKRKAHAVKNEGNSDPGERMQEVINALETVNLPKDATVYIVGAWLWIEFKTKPSADVREALKNSASGWKYIAKRGRWANPCGFKSRGTAKTYKPWDKYGQKAVKLDD